MAREPFSTIENNFSKGLITEASGLNFPPNSFSDADNIVINNDGSVIRRYGLEWETGGHTSTIVNDNYAKTEFIWESVAGDGDLTFVVIQIGSLLHFYEITSSGILSENPKAFTADLSGFELTASDAEECQYASGDGKLFVFNKVCEPFYIQYDSSTDTISTTQITIEIRDFKGVDDSLDIDERPSTLTDSHKYNLFNQGWYFNSNAALTSWDSARSDFPSNADVWFSYKNTSNAFDTAYIALITLGNTPAPQGHYIVTAFDTNRTDLSGLTVSENSSNDIRPRTGAFFAGRVWYAGVDAPGYNSVIYFSQIIEDNHQIGNCYQQNDPTSEEIFDLLPSDGGAIVIQDVGNILKLVPLQDRLIVIANNGIWSVSGSQGIGFQANDYAVSKLSGIGALSSLSVVLVQGYPLWWNANGIWSLSPTDIGDLKVQSVTEQTILTYYLEQIPPLSKKYAKGAYNPLTNTVKWMWSSSAPSTVDERYSYNRFLNLNLNFGAFYPSSVDMTNNPSINGIVAPVNTLSSSVDKNLFYFVASQVSSGTNYNFGFARETDEDYYDWTDTDYSSYLVTGPMLHSEGFRKFQSNYIYVYTQYLSGNSCQIQGIWNYANSGDSGYYTQKQEVCKTTSNLDTQVKRLTIRGSGLSLQLKFVSIDNNPFHLLGWSTYESRNAGP